MTKVLKFNGNDFFDDYAHHPTEIKSVLESLKKVVEYMHEFEFNHFEECDDEEKQNHIYKDVLKLQNFLNDS